MRRSNLGVYEFLKGSFSTVRSALDFLVGMSLCGMVLVIEIGSRGEGDKMLELGLNVPIILVALLSNRMIAYIIFAVHLRCENGWFLKPMK